EIFSYPIAMAGICGDLIFSLHLTAHTVFLHQPGYIGSGNRVPALMQFSGYPGATVYIAAGFVHFLYFLNKYPAPLFSRGLWRNQPTVKATGTNGQYPAHLLYGIYFAVFFYEPVYGPSPLEKMAMAFFNMSRSSSVSLSFLRKILSSCSSGLILGLSGRPLLPLYRGFLR